MTDPRQRKTVICFSGGLDSTVLLMYALTTFDEVIAVSFNYGQRHDKELMAARAICHALRRFRGSFVHRIIALNSAFQSMTSSLTDPDIPVPQGHYEDQSMRQTVVPNRNMIFLSVATALAIQHKAGSLMFAAHAGDHAIYPDCRIKFVNAMYLAIREGNYDHVKLRAPFASMTKDQIVRLGNQLGTPFEMTWSCYNGGDLHCGKCGTCVERKEAFSLAGVNDPTTYGDTYNGKA